MKTPVKVVRITNCEKVDGYIDPDSMFPKGWKPTKSYWTVDAGFIGNCGHEHETEEQAENCLEPMKDKYHSLRWPKKLKSKMVATE